MNKKMKKKTKPTAFPGKLSHKLMKCLENVIVLKVRSAANLTAGLRVNKSLSRKERLQWRRERNRLVRDLYELGLLTGIGYVFPQAYEALGETHDSLSLKYSELVRLKGCIAQESPHVADNEVRLACELLGRP